MVHGDEGQKEDTGQKVKNIHGAIELTEQLAKGSVVLQSYHNQLERQWEDDDEVSHGQVEVPHLLTVQDMWKPATPMTRPLPAKPRKKVTV